jgi:hypothetical protein
MVDKPKKYLIITSSGGGGHTNAAEGRKNELLKLGIPEEQISIVDLMGEYPKASNYGTPWVPTYSFLGFTPFFAGSANTTKWNESQKEGTEAAVRRLEDLVEMQPLAEAMQAKEVAMNLTEFLKNNDVQNIYNTQALSTPAICQAIVDYNKGRENQLEILTTVTDLITHRAEHFLNSLRHLTPEQKKILKMEIAAAPLCDPGENEKEFYAKYGISEGLLIPKVPLEKNGDKINRKTVNTKQSDYPSPVKDEYKNAPSENEKKQIVIKAGNSKELEYLTKQLGSSTIKISKASGESSDTIIEKKPNDKLITITMGSQGSNSVIEYMDEFARQIKANKDNIIAGGNINLCIAAGKNEPNSLYERVALHAEEIMQKIDPSIRDKIKILPLAFQDAKHMSSLLNNSDVLVSRSGGMSSMEAEATHGRNPNRKVFVHSEAKLKFPDNFPRHSYDATYEALMKGTVKWEGGNAEYLLRKIKASLGSPEVIDFGLSNTLAVKEEVNSLFHLAYEDGLKDKNIKTIEKLIREGSNPNLRFAGGTYIIDHCKDLDTKLLLIKYGAGLTPGSLAGLNKNDEKKLQVAQSNFKAKGTPKEPINYTINPGSESFDRELKGHKYLHPFEPSNIIEQVIVGMDNIGSFIKTKILRADSIHDGLDGVRLYLKTDPTAVRSPIQRLKQLRNFAFDSVVFLAKQPVNMVIKPISMLSNITKAGLVALGMLVSEAKEESSNICNYNQLKETALKAASDLGSSMVAWGTAALVVSGFGAPIALAAFGSTATVSLGAANLGAANAAAAGLNLALSQAIIASNAPAANAVLTAEGIAEWGIVRPLTYLALNPKKLFYQNTQEEKTELNVLGKRVQDLHNKAANTKISIEVRRQARAEIEKIQQLQVTENLLAPVINTIMPSLKETKGAKR